MKVGDLVKHSPEGSVEGITEDIFEDWGWMPDFCAGIILDMEEDRARIFYIDVNMSPQPPVINWFPLNELKAI